MTGSTGFHCTPAWSKPSSCYVQFGIEGVQVYHIPFIENDTVPLHLYCTYGTKNFLKILGCTSQGAGMKLCWEHLPSTNLAWVQFQPAAICGLSWLLVLALLRRLFSGFSASPPSTKTIISKFQKTCYGWCSLLPKNCKFISTNEPVHLSKCKLKLTFPVEQLSEQLPGQTLVMGKLTLFHMWYSLNWNTMLES